jgi:hypothetical protein
MPHPLCLKYAYMYGRGPIDHSAPFIQVSTVYVNCSSHNFFTNFYKLFHRMPYHRVYLCVYFIDLGISFVMWIRRQSNEL